MRRLVPKRPRVAAAAAEVASAAIAQSPEPPPTPGPKPVDPSPVAPAPPGPPNPTQPGPAGPPVDGPADPPPSPPDALDALELRDSQREALSEVIVDGEVRVVLVSCVVRACVCAATRSEVEAFNFSSDVTTSGDVTCLRYRRRAFRQREDQCTTLEADASSSHATREPSVKRAREDGSRLA